MPEFVLERIYNIMRENNITDTSRVGLYGLTYKENVDDVRESPTLQLLECMKKHLAMPLMCYDPFVKDKIVENQIFDLNTFLESNDMIVIMTGHQEIIDHQELLKDKIVLDTRKCIEESKYHL